MEQIKWQMRTCLLWNLYKESWSARVCLSVLRFMSYHRTNDHSWSGRGSWLSAGTQDSASLGLWRRMTVWIPEEMRGKERQMIVRWEVWNRMKEAEKKTPSNLKNAFDTYWFMINKRVKVLDDPEQQTRYTIHIQGLIKHINSEIIMFGSNSLHQTVTLIKAIIIITGCGALQW